MNKDLDISGRGFLRGLDGLRGVSILIVIIFHSFILNKTAWNVASLELIILSFDMGVDCFFVISGFLITRILLQTKDNPHYYKNFIIRRALRIIPLYYLLLLIAFVVIPSIAHPYFEKWKEVDSLYYWFFLSNMYVAQRGGFNHGLIDISWSLAIEEQFYLFWPWIIYFFKAKAITVIVTLFLILGIVLRAKFILWDHDYIMAHVFTFAHIDPLLIGGLFSVLLSRKNYIINAEFMGTIKKIGLSSLLFYIITLALRNVGITDITIVPFYPVISLLFLWLLVEGLKEQTIISNVLNLKWLGEIGKYSYAIYLFHNPICSALKYVLIGNRYDQLGLLETYFYQVVIIVLTTIITFIIAIMSYHLFEKHFLKLKKHFAM